MTGHTIPDSKLHSIYTAGHLVSYLVKPPPATKVAEAIEQQGELTRLPNVQVYATRRTPVHKHQQVGRWKVIEEELKKIQESLGIYDMGYEAQSLRPKIPQMDESKSSIDLYNHKI